MVAARLWAFVVQGRAGLRAQPGVVLAFSCGAQECGHVSA